MQQNRSNIVCLLAQKEIPEIETVRFTEDREGVVKDNETGLLWQQGHCGPMRWEEAVRHVQEFRLGGYTDWRLPSKEELETVADWRDCPAMDAALFENAITYLDWLTTKDAYQTDDECQVYFSNGFGGFGHDWKIYVRCVRG